MSGGALKRLLDCERRLWLSEHAHGHSAGRSEHDDMLGDRSRSLEDQSAHAIGAVIEPVLRNGVSFEEAAAETLRLLRETREPLRRPVLLSADGRLSASPGFILWEGDALVLRDVRLAHRPDKRRDNRIRLAFAGWLVRQLTGLEVARLEIVTGLGTTVTFQPESDEVLAALAARALELMGDSPEPDILMGHSHCQHCGHYSHCWDRAEADRRVEVLPAVTQRRAELLREEGIVSFDALAKLAPEDLKHFKHKDLRDGAAAMLPEARAWSNNAAYFLKPPGLPVGRVPVWFDVESDSDGERAGVPVYLWGLAVESRAVTGASNSNNRTPEPAVSARVTHEASARAAAAAEAATRPPFEPILAELDAAGDRDAWQRFCARVIEIFRENPSAVLVHWHSAEPMWIERYIGRLGAPDEFVKLMRTPGSMFDLHGALEKCVRLPLRSTSVKYVAPWLGFAWSNPNADAAWSTAQLHRAYACKDPAERAELLAEVARYNADDLWAMRVVWRWLAAQPAHA